MNTKHLSPSSCQLQVYQYHQLNALSRFYDHLSSDIVMAKNRLHKVLQFTFSELEQLFNTAKGFNYWSIGQLLKCILTVR